MRLSTVTLALVLALSLASPSAASEGLDPELTTELILFTGSPQPSPDSESGVLLAPGTVFPLDSGPASDTDLEASLADSRDVFSVADKLAATLRLQDIRARYRQYEKLAPTQSTELDPVSHGSSVRPVVTLLGRTAELATYRVVFRDGAETLSETSVSIPMGRRSIVGGLDGEEAPYLFLFLRPIDDPQNPDGFDESLTPPQVVSAPPPGYTEEAREAKVEGLVVVQAVIEADGTISNTRILKSLDPGLDRAARDAIESWTFEPARLDGEPVAVFYTLTLNFRLK